MNKSRVASSAFINTRPERVYAVLADYRRGHPKIVPTQYFKSLEVEEGGTGAGTKIRVTMRVLGTTKILHHVVTEPQPGRILVESDVDGSSATTFTIDPRENGTSTHLTIETEFTTRGGILGMIERYLASMMLRRIYRKEIALIAEYVGGN